MKINLNGEDSKIVKQNETYTLIDNTNLNGLVVSKLYYIQKRVRQDIITKDKKKYISLLVVMELW